MSLRQPDSVFIPPGNFLKRQRKILKLFLLSIFTIGLLYSQNTNILKFDSKTGKFEDTGSFPPYGEKIIVQGNYSDGCQGVTVKCSWGNNEQESGAVLNNGLWQVVVGPFPVNANVLFEIKESFYLNNEEIESLTTGFLNSIEYASTKFFENNMGMSQEQFNKFILKNTQEKLDTILQKNKLDKNFYINPLIEKIISSPLIINKIAGLSKFLKSDFYKIVVEEKDSVVSAKKIFDMINDGNYDQKLIDDFVGKDSTLITLETDARKSYQEYYNVKNILKEQFRSIIRTEIFYSQTNTSQEFMGIESYIGFDLGMVVIPEISSTPVFITVSPYLSKIDPAKDYRFTKKTWDKFLTPTFGVSLSNENSSPIYFAGIGFRLNKVVRLALGSVYYKSKETGKYEYTYAFSASVNTHFITDFLSMITATISAQSNIKTGDK